jgi:uncharacterized protein (TIGR02265 family)
MDTHEALQQRLTMASPAAQTRGMFFESAVAELALLLGPEVAEEARAVTSTREWVALFQYPVADLLRILDVGASTAERRGLLTYSQTLERLGGAAALCHLGSPLGKAFRALYANKDIHQALTGSPTTARLSSAYPERRYQRLSPTSALLLFRNEMMGPKWIHGFYLRGYQELFDLSLSVTLEDIEEHGQHFVLRFEW